MVSGKNERGVGRSQKRAGALVSRPGNITGGNETYPRLAITNGTSRGARSPCAEKP